MSDTEGMSQETIRLSRGGLVGRIERMLTGGEVGAAVKIQIVLCLALLWAPLVALTFIDGTLFHGNILQPFATDIVPQVRFLLALPLLIAADLAIDPPVGAAIRYLRQSGLVPPDQQEGFRQAVNTLERGRDAYWPDILMLLLALSIVWAVDPVYESADSLASSASWIASVADGNIVRTTAGWWYTLVSAPIFQLILFRWIWRFMIWAGFLFRVSKLRLAFQPDHPDLAGGLGFLGIAQQTFAIIFVSFSMVMSSTLGNNILFEGETLRGAALEVAVFIGICVVLIYLPLVSFSAGLYAARQRGLYEYGKLGFLLSNAFAAAWLGRSDEKTGAELKNRAEASSVADYGAIYGAVVGMRFLPVTSRNVVFVSAALIAPFVPLLLTKFSLIDLLRQITDSLV